MNSLEKFLDHIKTETKEQGIKLQLRGSRSVKAGDIYVNGYFDDETKDLVVARNHENWLEILVHEYSHFEQWKTKSKAFNDLEETDHIDEWLAGKNYKQSHINTLIAKLRTLEHDCEKRSVNNIKKFKLPIDIRLYSKKANAYVHFYNWVALRRRWYKIGKEPYNLPEILKAMNSTIDSNVSKTPNRLIELFDKYL